MIEIIFSGIVYTAALIGCYDGDTCTLQFNTHEPFLQKQDLRFVGFDTPEIRTKCPEEKQKAKLARAVTLNYLKQGGKLYISDEKNKKTGKYGRLLVSAPVLQQILLEKNLAKLYDGGKRDKWC